MHSALDRVTEGYGASAVSRYEDSTHVALDIVRAGLCATITVQEPVGRHGRRGAYQTDTLWPEGHLSTM